MPDHGCINIHASLLPLYRGAAPIQAAIIAGDRVTGVTTMLMDEGLDTGPILLQDELEIGPEETAGELAKRLSVAGAKLLIETLAKLDQGRLQPLPQPDGGMTMARRLRRSDGIIDWTASSRTIFNLLRGLTPWPGVSTTLREQTVKVVWGRPLSVEGGAGREPGIFLGVRGDHLMVSCGEDTVFGVERLQKAGRQAVPAKAFANGERLEVGERFG
jgi:methionyl-tRNA formyltransferase